MVCKRELRSLPAPASTAFLSYYFFSFSNLFFFFLPPSPRREGLGCYFPTREFFSPGEKVAGMDPPLALLFTTPPSRFFAPQTCAQLRGRRPLSGAGERKGPAGSAGARLGGQRPPQRSRLTHLCLPAASRWHFLTALFFYFFFLNKSCIFSKEKNNKAQLLGGAEIEINLCSERGF